MGKVINAPRLTAKLDDLSAQGRARISQAVLVGAGLIASSAKRSITEGSISGPGHVPSRPGQPPNADTGVLHTSIVAVQTGELQAQVHVNAPYASELEYGTSRMAARPFLQPAVDRTRAEVIDLFFRAIKSARGL